MTLTQFNAALAAWQASLPSPRAAVNPPPFMDRYPPLMSLPEDRGLENWSFETDVTEGQASFSLVETVGGGTLRIVVNRVLQPALYDALARFQLSMQRTDRLETLFTLEGE